MNRDTQKLSFLCFIIFSVAPLINVLKIPSSNSSILAENILCLQCSDHVCANVSISTSVGFLLILLKYSLIDCIDNKSKPRVPRLDLSVSSIPSLPIKESCLSLISKLISFFKYFLSGKLTSCNKNLLFLKSFRYL